jgi:hypothetical protein
MIDSRYYATFTSKVTGRIVESSTKSPSAPSSIDIRTR